MQFEIEVSYITPRQAIPYINWEQGKGILVVPILLIQSFTLLVVFNPVVIPNWFWIYLLVLYLAIGATSAFLLQKQTKLLLEKMADKPVIRFIFSDESVCIKSKIDHWEMQIQWKGFSKLKKFSKVWILCIKTRATFYFAIPTNLLTAEQQEFILAKLKENKVKFR